VARRQSKNRAGSRSLTGGSFRLADEVRYIQHRAAEHDGRVVTIGQLVLFSTASGDAWLLSPADHLATRLARDGDPLPVHIVDTETHFTIGWQGQYRIDGEAFVYADRQSSRIITILGYPINQLSRAHEHSVRLSHGDREGMGLNPRP
jgi:hypothetical protein